MELIFFFLHQLFTCSFSFLRYLLINNVKQPYLLQRLGKHRRDAFRRRLSFHTRHSDMVVTSHQAVWIRAWNVYEEPPTCSDMRRKRGRRAKRTSVWNYSITDT